MQSPQIMVECPACQSRYELPHTTVGRQARCAECGNVFRVGSDAVDCDATDDAASRLPVLQLDLSELTGNYWRRVIAGRFSLPAMGISVILHSLLLLLLSIWLLRVPGSLDNNLTAGFGLSELTEFDDEDPLDPGEVEDLEEQMNDPLKMVVEMQQSEMNVPNVLPGPAVDPSGVASAAGLDGGLTGVDAAVSRVITGRVQKAGGQTGAVQFSLIWETMNDLDLHVRTPRGLHLYYGNRRAGNGWLDVDMNVEPQTVEPVENMFFTKSERGKYTVFVDHFKQHPGQPTVDSFTLRAMIDGRETIQRGKVASGGQAIIFEFDADMRPERLPYRNVELREKRAQELLERMREVRKTNPRLAEGMRLRLLRDYPRTRAAAEAALKDSDDS